MTTALPTGTLDERLPPVKAIRVYLRQSKEQDQQRESVPTQRAECERLAYSVGVTRSEWARRIEYIDIDRAGDDFTGREELARLLREAQAGDRVFAWKQDRVGRDMIDSAAAIRELVKFKGAVLYTVETGSIPVTLDSAEQTALVMFRGMVAQGELERIRSRTRDGLRQRARDGFASGIVPFGYRTVLVDPNVTDRKKSKKRIEIDEALAPIVRRIVAMYIDGRGYATIARALNREGAPSPRGRGWAASSIWDILREPRYAGEWSHGERRVVRREGTRVIRAKAPETDVIRTDRPDLAIVPREDWARVQAAQAKRKRDWAPQRVAASSKAVHLLSGHLRCGECGGTMKIKTCHGRRPGWSKRYYVCTTRVRTSRCSMGVHLPAEDAEKKWIDYLRGSVLDQIEQSIRGSLRAEVERVLGTDKARAREAQDLRGEIENLRREQLRLVRLGAGTDDPIPEVVEALKLNHGRAKQLQEALHIATKPPLDLAQAERLEASAVAQVRRMREQLSAGEAREALTVLFPTGLRFRVGSGLWLIEGAASVPTVRNPDDVRIPDVVL